jgi:hypothetical protein
MDMDLFSALAFFLLVFPLWLIYTSRQHKQHERMITSQNETSRLLGELFKALNNPNRPGDR